MTSPIPFTLEQLDHVVLRVRDMPRALGFYCNVLGCVEERRVAQFGLVQLRAGGSLIDLVDIALPLGKMGGREPEAEGRNMDHFAICISPFDSDALRAHLATHSIAHGAIEQRYGAQGVGPSIYINDPDGNVIELKGPPATNS